MSESVSDSVSEIFLRFISSVIPCTYSGIIFNLHMKLNSVVGLPFMTRIWGIASFNECFPWFLHKILKKKIKLVNIRKIRKIRKKTEKFGKNTLTSSNHGWLLPFQLWWYLSSSACFAPKHGIKINSYSWYVILVLRNFDIT